MSSELDWKRLTGECLGSPSRASVLESVLSRNGLRLADASEAASDAPNNRRWLVWRLLVDALDSATGYSDEFVGALPTAADASQSTAFLGTDLVSEPSEGSALCLGVMPCSLEARGTAATGLTGLAFARACSACDVGEFCFWLARSALLLVLRPRLVDVSDGGKPTSAEGDLEERLGGAFPLRRVGTSAALFSSSNSKSSKRPFLGLSMHAAMLTSGDSGSKASNCAAWLALAFRGDRVAVCNVEAD